MTAHPDDFRKSNVPDMTEEEQNRMVKLFLSGKIKAKEYHRNFMIPGFWLVARFRVGPDDLEGHGLDATVKYLRAEGGQVSALAYLRPSSLKDMADPKCMMESATILSFNHDRVSEDYEKLVNIFRQVESAWLQDEVNSGRLTIEDIAAKYKELTGRSLFENPEDEEGEEWKK